MTEKKEVSRRKLLTAAGVAAAAPVISNTMMAQAPAQPAGQAPAQPAGGRGGSRGGLQPAPSDRIIMAGIGLRNRGTLDLRHLLRENPHVQFVGIADIREDAREAVKSIVDEHYKNSDCVMYRDANDVLSRPDVEAVLIATSDRWHACMAAWAAQSGKDMYEEKPGAMTIAEAYSVTDNCQRYGTVYQSGAQRLNQYAFEFASGLARSGKLGRLTAVHADTSIGGGPTPPYAHSWMAEEPEPDPLVFNWDKWLGPVMWRPYNQYYPNGGRGQFWDYHAGLLEWASHTVAMCQLAADMRHTHAIEYEPSGGEMTPAGLRGEYTVNCRYPNGVKLILRNHGWLGLGSCSNRFEGTEGWVETGDSGTIAVSDNLKSLLPKDTALRVDPTVEHIREFLHSVRSRIQPRANHLVTANTHIVSHCAYISTQLNRKLTWDPAKREFVNDEEANRMRSRAYREPWRMDALSTTM